MIKSTIITIQIIAFIIQIFCFIPAIDENAKRQYGRWFGIRIDSFIWNKLVVLMCLIILSLSIIIRIWS